MNLHQALIGIAAGGLLLAAGSAFGQGDSQRGQQVFQDNCSGCHVLTGEGYAAPPLAGVYGRKAGAVPGFAYSDAMKKSGIVWDDASLGQFLADPSKSIPGTAMAFNVTDAQQRDDVIAYLKAQSPGAH
jgi:cytochrome c